MANLCVLSRGRLLLQCLSCISEESGKPQFVMKNLSRYNLVQDSNKHIPRLHESGYISPLVSKTLLYHRADIVTSARGRRNYTVALGGNTAHSSAANILYS
jgi:hypothetical protein